MDSNTYQLAMMSQNQGQQPMGDQRAPMPTMPPMQSPMANPAIMAAKNPINEGTRAGMQAAKQSLALDEGDKQRAMGSAIMNFFANMAGSQSRSRSNAVGQSLLPAIQAYQMELKNRQGLNKTALDVQLKREKEEQDQANKMRDFEGLQNYRNKSLSIQERRLSQETQQQNEINKLRDAGVIPKDAIPFKSMPKGTANSSANEMRAYISKGPSTFHVIKDLREIKKLSDDFPDMQTDFARVLYNPSEKPSFGSNLSNMFVSKEKRAALDKMRKLSKNLMTSKIASISGKQVTDIYKKAIEEGLPRFELTKEGIDYVTNSMLEEYEPLYNDIVRSKDMYSKGLFVLPNLPSLNKESTNQSESSGNIMPEISEQPEDIEIEIEKIRAENPKLRNASREKVLEIYNAYKGDKRGG